MTDDQQPGSRLEQWVSTGATILAPATVLGAVLFYFGYVSARSQYAYFGIDVDTIGLSTQDYIMRSPQPLLVPLLVLTLLAAGFLVLNVAVRRLILNPAGWAADDTHTVNLGAGPVRRAAQVGRVLRWARLLGLALLAGGVLLLFLYAQVRDWDLYALVTPLLIGCGAAVGAYASSLLDFQANRRQARRRADGSVLARRAVAVLVYVIIAASIFWATATLAQWTGLGLAEYDAQHLDSLPSVILDTKEQLFLHDLPPGSERVLLPASAGQTFHYRYRGLRLLIESGDRMFLVPARWSGSDTTLVVTLDGSVRVQFQFQNQLP